jgi:hypothetical protein
MLKFAALILFVFCFVLAETAAAQNSQAKTDALIAALAKTKYKKKEKKNVSIEIYIDIKSEPVVKNNVSEYSGVYEADWGHRLELRVSPDGTIEGSGYDASRDDGSGFNDSKKRSFTLQNARIEGALLTATKIYDDGATEKFEAVFNNRTVVQGKNPNEIETRETKYNLGFIQSFAASTNRIFLDFK